MAEKTRQDGDQRAPMSRTQHPLSDKDVLKVAGIQRQLSNNLQEAFLWMLLKNANEIMNCLARAACIIVGVLDYLYTHDLTRFFLLIGIAIGYTTVQEGVRLLHRRS